METYFVSANGVTVICHDRDNVLEWVNFIIDRGMAPTVERKTV